MNHATLQIFIMTHNRPIYIVQALESILKSSFEDFKVIVSDNSTNDQTQDLFISNSDKRISYRRRSNCDSAAKHLQAIWNDIKSKYFMIFHDDDVIAPNYLKKAISVLDSQGEIIGVSSGYYLINGDKKTGIKGFAHEQGHIDILNPEELIRPYLRFSPHTGIYSGYIYRSNPVKDLRPNHNTGGKHSDVTFLMNVASAGKMCWLRAPLVGYRLHESQDSCKTVLKDRLKLLRYVYRNTNLNHRSRPVRHYRYVIWGDWLKHEMGAKSRPKLRMKIYLLLVPHFLRNKLLAKTKPNTISTKTLHAIRKCQYLLYNALPSPLNTQWASINLHIISALKLRWDNISKRDFMRPLSVNALGLSAESANQYSPSSGFFLASALNKLCISEEDKILDIGCGKGNAMRLFMQYPFGAITGLEISEHLLEIAKDNFCGYSDRRIDFIKSDASDFSEYDSYTHIYLYNPFPSDIVSKVADKIRDSLKRNPRAITIIYNNPESIESFTKHKEYSAVSSLPCDWGNKIAIICAS